MALGPGMPSTAGTGKTGPQAGAMGASPLGATGGVNPQQLMLLLQALLSRQGQQAQPAGAPAMPPMPATALNAHPPPAVQPLQNPNYAQPGATTDYSKLVQGLDLSKLKGLLSNDTTAPATS